MTQHLRTQELFQSDSEFMAERHTAHFVKMSLLGIRGCLVENRIACIVFFENCPFLNHSRHTLQMRLTPYQHY